MKRHTEGRYKSNNRHNGCFHTARIDGKSCGDDGATFACKTRKEELRSDSTSNRRAQSHDLRVLAKGMSVQLKGAVFEYAKRDETGHSGKGVDWGKGERRDVTSHSMLAWGRCKSGRSSGEVSFERDEVGYTSESTGLGREGRKRLGHVLSKTNTKRARASKGGRERSETTRGSAAGRSRTTKSSK